MNPSVRGSYIFIAMKYSQSLWIHYPHFKMWKLRWKPLTEKNSSMIGYNFKKMLELSSNKGSSKHSI